MKSKDIGCGLILLPFFLFLVLLNWPTIRDSLVALAIFSVFLLGILALYAYARRKGSKASSFQTSTNFPAEHDPSREYYQHRMRTARSAPPNGAPFTPPTINIGDGRAFEQHVKNLLIKHGYRVTETPGSGDFGVDLIASKQDRKLAVQVKNYAKPVGVSAVQEVASGKRYYGADHAWVVSRSGFTKGAKQLAKVAQVQLRQVDVDPAPQETGPRMGRDQFQ